MSNLKLNVRIGNRSATFDANQARAADFIAGVTMDEMLSELRDSTNFQLNKLAKNLPKLVENSYIGAVQYAAKSMIGLKSPRGIDNRKQGVRVMDPDGEGLEIAHWQSLSPRTIREQNEIHNTKGPGEFFNRSGALRMDLLSMARRLVLATGVVKVTYNGQLRDVRGRFTSPAASLKKVALGDFHIRLMPNINPATLPGLRTTNLTDHDPSLTFERKLGFSPAALRKLKGAGKGEFLIPGTHRPLMQPVFTYWTLNRIPRVIAHSITDSLPRVQKREDFQTMERSSSR